MAWTTDATFRAELERSHQYAHKVELIRGGAIRWSSTACIVDGTVNIDRNAAVRRRLTVTLGCDDLPTLTCFGDQLRVWSGVAYADATTDLVPVGLFEIASLEEDPGAPNRIKVDGYDLAQTVARRRWSRPYAVARGTRFSDAVSDIIDDRLPGTAKRIVHSDARTEVSVVFDGANDDPWQAVSRFALACGRIAWFAPDGTFMLTAPPSAVDPVAATLRDGAGATILSTVRREQADPGPNGVIVVGTNRGAEPDVFGEAWDDDPSSPTYRYGPYGERPVYVPSGVVHTSEQARQVAAVELAKLTLAGGSVQVSALARPDLDAGDRVRVVRQADGYDETFVLDTITLPLGPGQPMTLGAERPVVALASTIFSLGAGGPRIPRIAKLVKRDPGGDAVAEISGEETPLPASEPPDSSPILPDDPLPPDPSADPIDPETQIPEWSIPGWALEAPIIVPPPSAIESSDYSENVAGYRLPGDPDDATDPVRLPDGVVSGKTGTTQGTSAKFRNRIYFEDPNAASNYLDVGWDRTNTRATVSSTGAVRVAATTGDLTLSSDSGEVILAAGTWIEARDPVRFLKASDVNDIATITVEAKTVGATLKDVLSLAAGGSDTVEAIYAEKPICGPSNEVAFCHTVASGQARFVFDGSDTSLLLGTAGLGLMRTGASAANLDSGAGANVGVNGDAATMSGLTVGLTSSGTGNAVNISGTDVTIGGGSGAGDGVSLSGRIGFYGTAPIAKQTGVAVDAAGIHAALVNLGLIA